LTDTYYFDWSAGKINVLKNDAEDDVIYQTLDQLLDEIQEPSVLIGEATFESFNLEKRAAFMERCEREGHILLSTPNRLTRRRREALFPGIEKSDSVDVKVIRDIARDGVTHLKVPHISDQCTADRTKTGTKELVRLRSTRHLKPKKNGDGYCKSLISDKEILAEEIISHLPEFSTLSLKTKLAIGSMQKANYGYNKVIVPAVYVASQHTDNREDFERLIGLYHHGYPSVFRSDIMHWGWHRRDVPDIITLTDYRYAIRWLYHNVKDLDLRARVIPA